TKDEQEMEYLLRNLQPLCARVSELEREATKAEWDFRDRKFARWAEGQTGQYFEAEVIEVGNYAKALLRAEMQGIVVYIKGNDVALFDTIEVAITEVSIPQATIMATLMRKIASKE
ncbi:MAG: ribonuclease, partial [Sulfurovaceae bacterium]